MNFHGEKKVNFVLSFQLFSVSNFRTLTEIDKQVVFKLFELSINRYSEVNLIFAITKNIDRI
jgi:hypothetical protein